jgi:xanthine/uracil/vitamin C permease (AzgA family)
MALVNALDTRPTPWFWAINGAAGVLAASIAVAVNITFSISTGIWLSAICYLLVGAVALALVTESPIARDAVAAAAEV